MASLPAEDERAEREAADWFARLNTLSITSRALEDFQAWRRAPGNDAAYERMEALWEVGGRLQGDPDIARGVAQALNRRSWLSRLAGLWRDAPGLRRAATALAAGAVLILTFTVLQGEQYATGVGEQRLVSLDDGTRLRLDTDTRVKVMFGEDGRDVRLIKGQAFFDVAHDAARPFVVHADDAQVRALGTRFDVRLAGAAVKVTLVEGSVEVTDGKASKAWRLAAGETLATGEAKPQPRRIDVAAATSWTSGRLIFRETPLAQAVAEVNRYSRQKVVIDVARLQAVPVSGVFEVGDTPAFVAAVSDLFELEPEDANGEVRLRPRT